MRKVDIIIPVFQGEASLRKCMESVLRYPQKNPCEVIAINDCSPNPAIVAYLNELYSEKKITLINNEKNLGFVKSVNKGMSYHDDTDVVLLNSDTEVANDWLDRLIAAADKSRDIGTCTPFSNNAEICSFPATCVDNDLPADWDTAFLDLLFSQVVTEDAIEIPTAVGFCMYIQRKCLLDVGLFDAETYGRGYGEENDFCLRAQAKGWRNVLCPNVYVYHQGGVSFSDEKKALLQNAMATLDKLYPQYHGSIQRYIQTDPTKALRTLMVIELIRRSTMPRILTITHHLSGGTTRHVDELEQSLSAEAIFLRLKPADNGGMVLCLSLDKFNEQLLFENSELADALRLIRHLRITRVHIHHLIDIDEPWWSIPRELGVPYDVSLHDFYFINASTTLSDEHGRFVEDAELRDRLCAVTRPIPGQQTAAEWRAKTADILDNADRVIVPSQFAKSIYQDYFPTAPYLVAHHPDAEQLQLSMSVEVVPKEHGDKYRIAVLGALNKEKGADLLEACADLALKSNDNLEFYLVGYAYRPLNDSVRQTGPYNEADLDKLLADIDPHLIWFPCLWPETYSYTLSTAMKTGRPILAPDLGAFPERLSDRPHTRIVNWRQSAEEYLATLESMLLELYRGEQPRQDWSVKNPQTDLTYQHYLKSDKSTEVDTTVDSTIDVAFVAKHLSRATSDPSALRRESLLNTLYRVRQHRVGRYLSRLIPFEMQRSIKRALSRKAMHEIVNKEAR